MYSKYKYSKDELETEERNMKWWRSKRVFKEKSREENSNEKRTRELLFPNTRYIAKKQYHRVQIPRSIKLSLRQSGFTCAISTVVPSCSRQWNKRIDTQSWEREKPRRETEARRDAPVRTNGFTCRVVVERKKRGWQVGEEKRETVCANMSPEYRVMRLQNAGNISERAFDTPGNCRLHK